MADKTELYLQKVIEDARNLKRHCSIPCGNGNVYAYPGAEGSIHFGINGGKYGFCIEQGIDYGKGDPRNRRQKTGNE